MERLCGQLEGGEALLGQARLLLERVPERPADHRSHEQGDDGGDGQPRPEGAAGHPDGQGGRPHLGAAAGGQVRQRQRHPEGVR